MKTRVVRICGAYYHVTPKKIKDSGMIEPEKGRISIRDSIISKSEEYDTLLHEMSHGYLFYFLEGEHDRIDSIIEGVRNEEIDPKEAHDRFVELICETIPKVFMTLIADNPKLAEEIFSYTKRNTQKL